MWIPQLPRALWWSHNAHYHRWLLRHLPPTMGRVLEVGCGAGYLATAIADRANHVDAVDVSDVMIERARGRSASNVNWLLGDVLDETLPLAANGYDVVIAVSSLHHMPLRAGLQRLAALVRPGGLLAVVGHYRHVTVADRSLDVIALPANYAVGVALAARGRAGKPQEVDMPVREPTDTLAEIMSAAAEITPGALVRRRVYWRYSLLWRRFS